MSYTYDRTGLRSTKTVNGTTYHYAYAGDKLVWQEWDGNEMFFFYDESNAPIGFWYHPASGSNVTGYYMTTQQGDITRIEDVNGNVLATYEYDAWGKLISSSGSLATINPLRYRGYYYDTETELYYLSSRYYDPKVSRFINADSTDAVLSANGLYDQNLFVYCDNNPVMRADNEGGFWHVLVGAALGGVINVVTKAVTNAMEGESITKGLVSGFISGAASGALASIAWPAKIASYVPAIMTAGNAAISAAEEWWDQAHSGEKTINISDIVTSGVIGGVSGALGGTGNGLAQMSKLSNNTVSRVYRAVKHNGIKSGIKEASKAMSYYGKSTRTIYYSYLKNTTPKDLGTSVVLGTVGSAIGGNNRVANRFLNQVYMR